MLKKSLPHIIAIVVFYVITIGFFSPTYFDNKELKQGDILQYVGASKSLKDYRQETGEQPLWTNSMFSGMPAYLVNLEFDIDIIKNVHLAFSLGLDHPTNYIFLSFLSFYILLLSFGVRQSLAIAGALCFGLNTFSIIGLSAGHNAKIGAIAFMPLVLAGIHLTFKGKNWLGFAVTALAVALELRINHLQITYYLLLIIAGYGIMQFVVYLQEKKLRDFAKISAILLFAAVLGAGANMGRILTVLEYSKYSTRGVSELDSDRQGENAGLSKEYAFDYSNGILEPLVLFIPNFYGGSSQQELATDSNTAEALKNAGMSGPQLRNQLKAMPTYWGPQRFSAPYYAGAIAVFLMVLAFFVVERKYKFWLGALIAFSIVLSWGNNFSAFNYFVFDYLPGYNKFRSVTFTIIIAIFCINLLAFYGLERFLSTEISKEQKKKFLYSLAISGGFALFVVIFAGVGSFRASVDSQLPDWLVGAIRADREALMRSDAFRSLIFIALAASAIFLYFSKKINYTLFSVLIVALVGLDLFTVAGRYLDKDNYVDDVKRQLSLTAADQSILQSNNAQKRVLNLNNPFNESTTSYYHASVGGYHGAKMGRYQDLIEYCLSPAMQSLINDLQSGTTNTQGYPVLDMLNTGYFKFGPEANNVIANPTAYGSAWFVENVLLAESASEELDLTCEQIDERTAVIDQSKFEVENSNYSRGSIKLESHTPNRIVYSSKNSGRGLAIFSEIYYPVGWTAYVDGEEAEILRANYVLRALELPAGNHELIFEFDPASYKVGSIVMIVSSLLIVLIFLSITFIQLYRLYRVS